MGLLAERHHRPNHQPPKTRQLSFTIAVRSDLTVLAIDDDANYLMLIEHAWSSSGINSPLHCATSGDKAIEYLKGEGEYSDRSRFPIPGLIMMDLRMDHGDGFSVLHRLKSNPEWMGIRRVVLTGSSYPEDIRKSYQLGACAYHVKPDAHQALVKLLKTMFEYWLTSEVAPSGIADEQIKTHISPLPADERQSY